MKRPLLIAEVKTTSPFGYRATKAWDEQFIMANESGDWISIHTDERWGGSFDLLERARGLTTKPILAKGIHRTDDEIEKAIGLGADQVLVVSRLPLKYTTQILYEPATFQGLCETETAGIKVVWNSRDIRDGTDKPESLEMARTAHADWLCQASNISSIEDVSPLADAVLVGQGLASYIESINA